MRRAPRDPWYGGRGMCLRCGLRGSACTQSRSGDARTRVGGSWHLSSPASTERHLAGWSKAESALDTVSGVFRWWLHDLRHTLATGLQRLGVRLEVTEAVLNHLNGSRAGVVGIYQRHDWAEEKRSALHAWSAHLLAAAEGRLLAVKVLPFSRTGSGEI